MACAALVGCGGGGGGGSATGATGAPESVVTTPVDDGTGTSLDLQGTSLPGNGATETVPSKMTNTDDSGSAIGGVDNGIVDSAPIVGAPIVGGGNGTIVPPVDAKEPAPIVTAPAPAAPAPAPVDYTARPFTADSPWNKPIASDAKYRTGDARSVSMQNISKSTPLAVNTRAWTMWVWQAKESDPMVSINVSVRNLDGMAGSTNPRAGTVTINMPAGAHPDPASYSSTSDTWGDSDGRDAHMTIISPDGKYAHEFWHVEKQGGYGAIKAVSYARVPLDGHGVNITNYGSHNPDFLTYGWGATRAYGGSNLGGLIRKGEATQGSIDHAIAIALPAKYLGGRAVYPATTDDQSPDYAGVIPMGTRFAIPKSVNINSLGLSPAHLRLAKALQEYGAIVVDKSGSPCMYAEGSEAQADGNALNANRGQMALLQSLLVAVE